MTRSWFGAAVEDLPLPDARVEDLENALRLVVTILENDGRHEVTVRDEAALAVAADALRLDPPVVPVQRSECAASTAGGKR